MFAATADLDSTEVLRNVSIELSEGDTILELGSGCGRDVKRLSTRFSVTGSDISPAVVELLREDCPQTEILLLDAASPAVNRRFDLIFSNKVLQYLAEDQLEHALLSHRNLLGPGGSVFHTFWKRSCTEERVRQAAEEVFNYIRTDSYSDLAGDDSFYLSARNAGA